MKKLYFCLVVATMLFAGCQKEDGSTPPAKGKVTYVVMVAIDDDIADGALASVKELITNSTQSDQVLMAVNYNKTYRKKHNIKGTIYYHAKDGKEEVIEQTEVMDQFGEDSKYLTKVLDMAVDRAPAEEYVLIFNSHGGGWTDTDAGDRLSRTTLDVNDERELFGGGLTLNRMLQGYQNSKMGQAGKKIKMVYFDNCLMHAAEYLTQMHVMAEYSLGSPTYSTSVTNVCQDMMKEFRTTTNYEQSIIKIAKYMAEDWAKNKSYTLVSQAVRLDKMADIPAIVGKMVDRILALVNADPAKLSAVQAVRSSTFMYSYAKKSTNPNPLYDMGDYLFRIKEALADDAVYSDLLDQFMAVANQAVLVSVRNSASPEGEDYDVLGDLAQGNEKPLFSVTITSYQDSKGTVSEYLGEAYSTLQLQKVGRWVELLKKLNAQDSRLPNTAW